MNKDSLQTYFKRNAYKNQFLSIFLSINQFHFPTIEDV